MLGFFRIFASKIKIILHLKTYQQINKGKSKHLNQRGDTTMKIKFFALMAFVLFAGQGAWAQDDMYFTPKKKAKSQSVVSSEVVDADAPYRYRIPDGNTVEDDADAYYSGSERDIDEYNRRGTSYNGTPQSHYEEIDADDSITISREEYDDFVNSRNMQRFDGYSGLSIYVNDPWYYDSWYWGSPYYYNTWRYNSWYYPWYTSSWYDPWYYGSWRYGGYYNGWYGGYYSWHRPYYGHRHWGGYVNTRGGIVNGHRASNRSGSYSNRGVRGVRSGSTNGYNRNSTTARGNAFGNRSNASTTRSNSSSSNSGSRSTGITPRSSSYGNYGNSSYSNSSTTRSSGYSSGSTTRSSGSGSFSSGGGSRGGGFSGGGGGRSGGRR